MVKSLIIMHQMFCQIQLSSSNIPLAVCPVCPVFEYSLGFENGKLVNSNYVVVILAALAVMFYDQLSPQ